MAVLYSWKPERKASRTCIKHFINEARKYKEWLNSLTPEWLSKAAGIVQQSYERDRNKSLRQLARDKLEYGRLRAYLGTEEKTGGSFCPAGWPWDRPAHDLWRRLNANN
jgi:hypothetical protein